MFVGIFIGIFISQYGFPILDILLDVFRYKLSELATLYQIRAKEMAAIFSREYPEINQQDSSIVDAIGFKYNPPSGEEYYDDE